MRPLNIPVVLGTTRKGRHSVHVAKVVCDLLNRRAGVESSLLDLANVSLPVDDAGEAVKDAGFAAAMAAADGLVLVVPEYNHSFPGLLKHVLDSCLSEYVHKAVGIVGVSSGPFGGTRVIQGLLPVMREVGLVTIFWDINVGGVERVFDDAGQLVDQALVRRSDKFLRELLWMSKTLRDGRERVTIDEEAAERARPAVVCPECSAPMNHHADKAVTADAGPAGDGVLVAVHACVGCGMHATMTVGEPAVAAMALRLSPSPVRTRDVNTLRGLCVGVPRGTPARRHTRARFDRQTLRVATTQYTLRAPRAVVSSRIQARNDPQIT